MKIIYISKYACTPGSGHPTRQYFFSKHLADLGNNVMLVYSQSNGTSKIEQTQDNQINEANDLLTLHMIKGPYISLGMNLKRIWSWVVFEYRLFRSFKMIKEFQPDIILVSSLSILTFVTGVFLKKRLNCPLVLEVRDLYPLTLIEVGGRPKFHPVVKLLSAVEKYGYRNADLLISTLENTREYFEMRKGDTTEFKWLPMGIDPDLYSSEGDQLTVEIINEIRTLKSAGKFTICYAGAIGTANALENILELTLDDDFISNNIHLIIIGNGPLRDYYRNKYKNDSISFFNSVQKKYVPLILRECDLLVNTWLNRKIYKYGISPNKWIDYMYSERPIILNLNARSKIFEEADFGWQITSENISDLKHEILKIERLDRKILDKKGENGKRYLMANLTYSKLSKELESTLDNCLDRFRTKNKSFQN